MPVEPEDKVGFDLDSALSQLLQLGVRLVELVVLLVALVVLLEEGRVAVLPGALGRGVDLHLLLVLFVVADHPPPLVAAELFGGRLSVLLVSPDLILEGKIVRVVHGDESEFVFASKSYNLD